LEIKIRKRLDSHVPAVTKREKEVDMLVCQTGFW